MTMLERRLQQALRAEADVVEPAPDLFARVRGSIDDDRRRRSQRRRGAAVAAALAGALLAVVVAVSDIQDGRVLMEWWVLEAITTAILIGLALWLGPFIKRFGRAYAADVFHDNPLTGKSYIVLTDIVYYLIFAAYILGTSTFAPKAEWRNDISEMVTASQVQSSAARVAGILVIIGILHGLNIVLMPVLGRLFSLNRKLSAEQRDPDPLRYP
jgi:type III secretory pathway component EscS